MTKHTKQAVIVSVAIPPVPCIGIKKPASAADFFPPSP